MCPMLPSYTRSGGPSCIVAPRITTKFSCLVTTNYSVYDIYCGHTISMTYLCKQYNVAYNIHHHMNKQDK